VQTKLRYWTVFFKSYTESAAADTEKIQEVHRDLFRKPKIYLQKSNR